MKKGWKVLVLLLLFLVLTTTIADAAPKVPPTSYTGPVADRPVFVPGEYWIWEKKDGSRVKWEFLREEGDLLVFQSGKRKDLLYTDRNQVYVKKIHGKTGEILYEKSPGWLRLEFPLWVGKNWDFTYDVMSQNFGTMVPIDARCRVASYEDIKLKAGTALKAFRIEGYWRARGYEDNGTWTLYYLPEAKTVLNKAAESQLVEFKVLSP